MRREPLFGFNTIEECHEEIWRLRDIITEFVEATRESPDECWQMILARLTGKPLESGPVRSASTIPTRWK